MKTPVVSESCHLSSSSRSWLAQELERRDLDENLFGHYIQSMLSMDVAAVELDALALDRDAQLDRYKRPSSCRVYRDEAVIPRNSSWISLDEGYVHQVSDGAQDGGGVERRVSMCCAVTHGQGVCKDILNVKSGAAECETEKGGMQTGGGRDDGGGVMCSDVDTGREWRTDHDDARIMALKHDLRTNFNGEKDVDRFCRELLIKWKMDQKLKALEQHNKLPVSLPASPSELQSADPWKRYNAAFPSLSTACDSLTPSVRAGRQWSDVAQSSARARYHDQINKENTDPAGTTPGRVAGMKHRRRSQTCSAGSSRVRRGRSLNSHGPTGTGQWSTGGFRTRRQLWYDSPTYMTDDPSCSMIGCYRFPASWSYYPLFGFWPSESNVEPLQGEVKTKLSDESGVRKVSKQFSYKDTFLLSDDDDETESANVYRVAGGVVSAASRSYAATSSDESPVLTNASSTGEAISTDYSIDNNSNTDKTLLACTDECGAQTGTSRHDAETFNENFEDLKSRNSGELCSGNIQSGCLDSEMNEFIDNSRIELCEGLAEVTEEEILTSNVALDVLSHVLGESLTICNNSTTLSDGGEASSSSEEVKLSSSGRDDLLFDMRSTTCACGSSVCASECCVASPWRRCISSDVSYSSSRADYCSAPIDGSGWCNDAQNQELCSELKKNVNSSIFASAVNDPVFSDAAVTVADSIREGLFEFLNENRNESESEIFSETKSVENNSLYSFHQQNFVDTENDDTDNLSSEQSKKVSQDSTYLSVNTSSSKLENYSDCNFVPYSNSVSLFNRNSETSCDECFNNEAVSSKHFKPSKLSIEEIEGESCVGWSCAGSFSSLLSCKSLPAVVNCTRRHRRRCSYPLSNEEQERMLQEKIISAASSESCSSESSVNDNVEENSDILSQHSTSAACMYYVKYSNSPVDNSVTQRDRRSSVSSIQLIQFSPVQISSRNAAESCEDRCLQWVETLLDEDECSDSDVLGAADVRRLPLFQTFHQPSNHDRDCSEDSNFSSIPPLSEFLFPFNVPSPYDRFKFSFLSNLELRGFLMSTSFSPVPLGNFSPVDNGDGRLPLYCRQGLSVRRQLMVSPHYDTSRHLLSSNLIHDREPDIESLLSGVSPLAKYKQDYKTFTECSYDPLSGIGCGVLDERPAPDLSFIEQERYNMSPLLNDMIDYSTETCLSALKIVGGNYTDSSGCRSEGIGLYASSSSDDGSSNSNCSRDCYWYYSDDIDSDAPLSDVLSLSPSEQITDTQVVTAEQTSALGDEGEGHAGGAGVIGTIEANASETNVACASSFDGLGTAEFDKVIGFVGANDIVYCSEPVIKEEYDVANNAVRNNATVRTQQVSGPVIDYTDLLNKWNDILEPQSNVAVMSDSVQAVAAGGSVTSCCSDSVVEDKYAVTSSQNTAISDTMVTTQQASGPVIDYTDLLNKWNDRLEPVNNMADNSDSVPAVDAEATGTIYSSDPVVEASSSQNTLSNDVTVTTQQVSGPVIDYTDLLNKWNDRLEPQSNMPVVSDTAQPYGIACDSVSIEEPSNSTENTDVAECLDDLNMSPVLSDIGTVDSSSKPARADSVMSDKMFDFDEDDNDDDDDDDDDYSDYDSSGDDNKIDDDVEVTDAAASEQTLHCSSSSHDIGEEKQSTHSAANAVEALDGGCGGVRCIVPSENTAFRSSIPHRLVQVTSEPVITDSCVEHALPRRRSVPLQLVYDYDQSLLDQVSFITDDNSDGVVSQMSPSKQFRPLSSSSDLVEVVQVPPLPLLRPEDCMVTGLVYQKCIRIFDRFGRRMKKEKGDFRPFFRVETCGHKAVQTGEATPMSQQCENEIMYNLDLARKSLSYLVDDDSNDDDDDDEGGFYGRRIEINQRCNSPAGAVEGGASLTEPYNVMTMSASSLMGGEQAYEYIESNMYSGRESTDSELQEFGRLVDELVREESTDILTHKENMSRVSKLTEPGDCQEEYPLENNNWMGYTGQDATGTSNLVQDCTFTQDFTESVTLSSGMNSGCRGLAQPASDMSEDKSYLMSDICSSDMNTFSLPVSLPLCQNISKDYHNLRTFNFQSSLSLRDGCTVYPRKETELDTDSYSPWAQAEDNIMHLLDDDDDDDEPRTEEILEETDEECDTEETTWAAGSEAMISEDIYSTLAASVNTDQSYTTLPSSAFTHDTLSSVSVPEGSRVEPGVQCKSTAEEEEYPRIIHGRSASDGIQAATGLARNTTVENSVGDLKSLLCSGRPVHLTGAVYSSELEAVWHSEASLADGLTPSHVSSLLKAASFNVQSGQEKKCVDDADEMRSCRNCSTHITMLTGGVLFCPRCMLMGCSVNAVPSTQPQLLTNSTSMSQSLRTDDDCEASITADIRPPSRPSIPIPAAWIDVPVKCTDSAYFSFVPPTQDTDTEFRVTSS